MTVSIELRMRWASDRVAAGINEAWLAARQEIIELAHHARKELMLLDTTIHFSSMRYEPLTHCIIHSDGYIYDCAAEQWSRNQP